MAGKISQHLSGVSSALGLTGGKKRNGHKLTCGCPICLNMKKKGGDDNLEQLTSPLEQEINVAEEEIKNDNEVVASDTEYKELDLEGGAKKRRTKRKG